MNQPTETEIETSQRIHYLDNLRALAMLLGVVLHGGLAYAEPAQSVWLATDLHASRLMDVAIWFIHLFRMSLFYLLAGYFSKLVVAKKGWPAFLRQRFVRIVLPFILFYPFLLIAMGLVIGFALSYLEQPHGVMGLIAGKLKTNVPGSESNSLTTMHLWFLYYLLIFTLLSWLGARIPKLNFEWLYQRTWPWWLLPLALAPAVLTSGVPLPAPESFVPHWWPIIFYGAFYWTGWQLFGRERFLDRLQPLLLWLMLASLFAFGVYYACMPKLVIDDLATLQKPTWTLKYCIAAVLTGYLSVWLTWSSLLLGKRFLALEYGWLRWLADASYWVYLLHLPIVVLLQTVLVPLDWPVWLKFSATMLGTMIPCLATYVVCVRYTPIGWMLHGKRSFP